MTERTITLSSGHGIWTRSVGGGPGLPLLILHGGPGAGHDYLEPLEELGADRSVVFYDQLGCGRSDKPVNRGLWTIERFADEVAEVRAALGLGRCHILGHSWGGWLLIEYMLRQPGGVEGIILGSTSASVPEFTALCDRLKSELPPAIRATLAHHEALGEYAHPDYLAASREFYTRHVCRLAEWPDCLKRSGAYLDGNAVYDTINGPNEFTTIGNLRYWNRTADLSQIGHPVLITCGRYDELGPSCAATLEAGLPDARTVVFETSAHCAHLEETDAYLATVRDFLAGVERR